MHPTCDMPALEVHGHIYTTHNTQTLTSKNYITASGKGNKLTFRAISKQTSRSGGRPKIRLHTVPRPWVTRSPSPSFNCWLLSSDMQRSSSNLNEDSGRYGASHKSLLKDLSEAGSESIKDLAWR